MRVTFGPGFELSVCFFFCELFEEVDDLPLLSDLMSFESEFSLDLVFARSLSRLADFDLDLKGGVVALLLLLDLLLDML